MSTAIAGTASSSSAKASGPCRGPWLCSGEPLEYYPLYNLSVPDDEGSAMSICLHPCPSGPRGLQAAVLGQDSARHRRFRSVASDCNLGFRGGALHWYSNGPAMEPDEAMCELSAKWARIWSGGTQ